MRLFENLNNQHPRVFEAVYRMYFGERMPLRSMLKHRIRWYTRWFTKEQFSFIYVWVVAITTGILIHYLHVWGWT